MVDLFLSCLMIIILSVEKSLYTHIDTHTHEHIYVYIHIFLFSPKDIFIDFGEGGEGERSVVSSTCPNLGSNQQRRYVN